ncbi:MAG: tRNA uridine-5-carboxymethylaminomethyl(34) synthesis enzyme MnmG [Chlamydiota bacterium]
MWNYSTEYDVIVVGGGHAGCEAAHAAAKMGARTLLLTMNLDSIAKMSCNPSIGGTAKGHLVREIDALGGIMGKMADRSSIHFRMLNASKGPAVRSPRVQVDKHLYSQEMKQTLEKIPNLEIKQGTATFLVSKDQKCIGISTLEGVTYLGKCIVITTGTFLEGKIFMGHTTFTGGRLGDMSSVGLSASLVEAGLTLGRLKTGTPARIHKRSIDFSTLEEQEGEEGFFSFDEKEKKCEPRSCHITYTTEETKKIIQENLQKSALFSGLIRGVGPRYCPSIEDKIVRFAHRDRHQIFLEPEGIHTDEYYLNGLSTSLPLEVQVKFIRSIPGLENAEIMRPAYAIEYDWVTSGQLLATLETKKVQGLFLAGQINGTTGYEEAAGQGLVAGINAALQAMKRPPCFFHRSESYLGVMIDDLITKEIDEPYRLFTSRAEHRLLLRQDNADLRLRPLGFQLGMISQAQMDKVQDKRQKIQAEKKRLSTLYVSLEGKSIPLFQLICRPDYNYEKMIREFPLLMIDYGKEINEQIETELKYAGYISRQEKDIVKLENLEKVCVPKSFSYKDVLGLRNEAKEKLSRFSPPTLGSASRISGITPADLSILLVALQKKHKENIL